MTAQRKLRVRLLSAAVVALALIAAPFGVSSAMAAPPPPVAKYVSLGDSYAAGQGAGGYVDACMNSTSGYPAQLGQVPRINLLRTPSCSGATIADVMSSQIGSVNRGTTMITITAGGDDLNPAAVWAACVPDSTSETCQQAIGAATTRVGAVGPAMVNLIMTVKGRSPNAVVIVTGYPHLFGDYAASHNPTLTAINDGIDGLNAQLTGAAAATGAVFAPVDFGDHAIYGADTPWFGMDPADPVSLFHPTADGYAAYAQAVLAVRP
ncbi:MAG: SGNH/GDSL hydrolase family protein [Actinobacteria bacterium]|nr:SGNH/GDSL hydrolase family protein [Actinomycetota bacterium]